MHSLLKLSCDKHLHALETRKSFEAYLSEKNFWKEKKKVEMGYTVRGERKNNLWRRSPRGDIDLIMKVLKMFIFQKHLFPKNFLLFRKMNCLYLVVNWLCHSWKVFKKFNFKQNWKRFHLSNLKVVCLRFEINEKKIFSLFCFALLWRR